MNKRIHERQRVLHAFARECGSLLSSFLTAFAAYGLLPVYGPVSLPTHSLSSLFVTGRTN